MNRRILFFPILVGLALALLVGPGGRADEPVPAAAAPVPPVPVAPDPVAADPVAADPVAPTPPAGAVGLLIANKATGFEAGLDKRAVQAIFRGVLQTAPSGSRVLIYLLPMHDVALTDVLTKTLSWSEVVFEHQSPTIEANLGRIYFKRLASSTAVVAAVSSDLGGVGIVSAETRLTPDVVILWPAVTP